MRVLYRWFALVLDIVLSLVVVFSLMSDTGLIAKADITYTEYNGNVLTVNGSDEDYTGFFDDETRNETAQIIWTFLKSNGFNDVAISAMIGNFVAESSLKYSASEGGTSDGADGRGIAQWTTCETGGLGTGVHKKIAEFASSTHGHLNKTPNSSDIANTWLDCLECQLKFLISDPSYGNKNLTACGFSSHTKTPVSPDAFYLVDFGSYDWLGANNNDLDKAIQQATEIYCFRWEVPSNYYSHIQLRVSSAKEAYKVYSNMKIDAKSKTVTKEKGKPVTYDGALSWVTEEYFVDVSEFKENDLQLMSARDLTLVDRTSVGDWRRNIEYNKKELQVRYPRSSVMFIGILLMVYSILLYLAYWFDRVNNFLEISLLGILTMGRFQVSPDDIISNFKDSGGGTKILVHKDIVSVVLIGVAIGIFLVSGRVFNFTDWLLRIIRGIF